MPDRRSAARAPRAPLRPPAARADARADDARARLDAALGPLVLGTASAGGMLTERRVAAAARDAAAAVLPLLGEPRRSAHRVRALLTPVLVCGWAEFDAAYAAALDALLALPPAVPGVEDPTWDAALAPVPAERAPWVRTGEPWAPPEYGAEAVGPAGTAGRVVRRGAQMVLVTGDGRPVRLRARCDCTAAERRAHAPVPYEHVHLRRDGSVLDVTVGAACGRCRAPLD